jgi:hypothetical protein
MFLWIPVMKVVQAERTLLGDVEGATKACRVVCKEAIELAGGFEVMLCVCADRMARLREDLSSANTG